MNRTIPQPRDKVPEQAKPHTQFVLPPQVFDAFNKDLPTQTALGSKRGREVQEASEIHSSNFKMVDGVIVSGWRLTRRGLEIVPTGVFPPGSLLFADIQDIAVNKILGRITAGSGVIEQLSAANVKTILALVAADISNFNEAAEDAVGGILADSATIDFDYSDGGDSITASIIPAYRRKSLFDHFADVGNIGTGEDDLYSDTIAAGQLANNGEKLEAEYSLAVVLSATATRQIKVYFAGTLIMDSGALTFGSNGAVNVYVTIIRESSSVVRCMAELAATGLTLQPISTYTRITGLTLSNTQVLKITGEAAGVGAATDDIIAKLGLVEWKAAA